MAINESWVKDFRQAIKASIGLGWQVSNDRGNMRLLQGNKKEGFKSINLPYKWQEDQWVEALKYIEEGASIYFQYKGNHSLKTAFALANKASSQYVEDWDKALKNYRNSNRHTIKEKTWKAKHLPVIEGIFFYINKAKHKPQNGKTLWNKVSNEYKHGKNGQLVGWEHGSTQRRHMRLAFNRFLRWCVEEEDFKSYWNPPKYNKLTEEVTRQKRIGYPLTDSQIGRIVDAFGDSEEAQKWKFATQLCAVYGLRPEELRYLKLRNNKQDLWCTYEKANSKFSVRKLFAIEVRDTDGQPFDWCADNKLLLRLAADEKLPEIKEGEGSQRFGTQLRKNSPKNVWLSICEEAEAEDQECTPYSFRHRYASVGNTRPKKDGTFISPKKIAKAMGHDYETHLRSYGRFNARDLEDDFDLLNSVKEKLEIKIKA